jgi:predicted ATPase/class 3 adenylate cyclase
VGGDGRSGGAPPRHNRELPGFRDEEPVADPRMGLEEFPQELAWHHKAAQRPCRDDIRDGRLAEQNGYLTEEIPASERSQALSPRHERGLTLKDDVERGSGETLAQNLFVLSEIALLERVGHLVKLGTREVSEDRETGKRFGDVVRCRAHDAGLRRPRSLGKPRMAQNPSRMSVGKGLPAGTLTFLFTDIEGSTKLQSELGTDRYQDVLETHTRILRKAFKDGGVEVRVEGDALFVVFPVAVNAIRAAAAAQRALATARFPHGATVRVRMGMHTGEGRPASVDAGADYVGIDVNRAARVAAAGHGGQVLLTAVTVALARAELGDGVSVRDLGEFRLKDLANPEHVYQLVISGSPADFPALRTLDRIRTFLPPQPSTFIGRAREIAEGRRLLDKARLITLTGPGGTGKTRLSLRIAEESADAFGDGTYFVPLAPITDPDLVPSTIAHTLGVQLSGAEIPLTRVLDHVRGKAMLLVLDNFEQILPAAPVVAQLLDASATLKVIATSRAPLRIGGEQEFPIPPLDLPNPERLPSLEVLTQSDAVRLFIERATAVRPDFRVTPENAAAVAEIVYRLDGLPLAIELAAARVKVLTPQAMLPKLRQGLDMLASTARDLPERQRTLNGAISWSWDLLNDAEKRLFRRLGVFVAGALLPQIEAVSAESDVLDVLSSLVEHSLVRQSEVDGEPRFRMLVTIREYSLERLTESDERDLVRARHAHAYLALAEQARPYVQGSDQRRWLDLLEQEHDNLRAAIESSIEDRRVEDACRLVFALWRFWQVRSHLVEGAHWCERVLALPTTAVPPLVLMRALEASAGMGYWRGDIQMATDGYVKASEIAHAHGDDEAQANAEYNLSFVYGIPGSDLPQALDLLRSAREKWARVGNRLGVARAAWGLGTFLQFGRRGTIDPSRLDEARAAVQEALAVHRAGTNRFDLGWSLHLAGMIDIKRGDFANAATALREAAQIFTEDNDLSGLTIIASDCAELAAAQGQPEREATLVGFAGMLTERAGTGLLGEIERRDGRPAPKDIAPEFRAALERGRAMDLAVGIAYALGEREISRD